MACIHSIVFLYFYIVHSILINSIKDRRMIPLPDCSITVALESLQEIEVIAECFLELVF